MPSPNPIIKIKTGNTKPVKYQEFIVNGVFQSTSGLSAGELGAVITAPNYALYVGNTAGEAITFGCEIDPNVLLGTSDNKVPTQKALKTYIDNKAVSTSSTGIISRYLATNLSIANGVSAPIPFATTEYSSGSLPTELTYNSANFNFTNVSGSAIYLMVIYQVTWTVPTVSLSYTDTRAFRSAWIQKFTTSIPSNDNAATRSANVYGYTSLIVPPLISSSIGAVSGTQNGSALIELSPNQSFSIFAKNHATTTFNAFVATASGIATAANQNPLATNFENATRVQIVRV